MSIRFRDAVAFDTFGQISFLENLSLWRGNWLAELYFTYRLTAKRNFSAFSLLDTSTITIQPSKITTMVITLLYPNLFLALVKQPLWILFARDASKLYHFTFNAIHIDPSFSLSNGGVWGKHLLWDHPVFAKVPGDWKSRLHKRCPPARTVLKPVQAGLVCIASDF